NSRLRYSWGIGFSFHTERNVKSLPTSRKRILANGTCRRMPRAPFPIVCPGGAAARRPRTRAVAGLRWRRSERRGVPLRHLHGGLPPAGQPSFRRRLRRRGEGLLRGGRAERGHPAL